MAHATDKTIVYTKKEKVCLLWYRRIYFDIHLFQSQMQRQKCYYVTMMAYVLNDILIQYANNLIIYYDDQDTIFNILRITRLYSGYKILKY